MKYVARGTIWEKIVIACSILFSLVAIVFCFTHNYILTYNDAASHLNIARRVFDNLTPGFAQIGTVWLPLPHVLMIPFAASDFLWHTGLAGSIVSGIAYIICIFFVYKLIFVITKNHIGASIGALIMALNPNFLYLQTTPMTEPLLLMTCVIAMYCITKYVESRAVSALVLTGVFTALATLTRYDGWFLFITILFLLPLWVYRMYGKEEAEGSFLLFLFSGGFGIFLWILWNTFIFGDPLYFITGPYSAYAQQRVLKQVGQLPTEGHIGTSLSYYFWSMADNNGIVLLLAAIVALCLISFFFKQKKFLLTILVILSPVIFNIIALFLGQSAMNVPQAATNPGMFNIRYGIMALPAIAIILGILASQKIVRLFIIILLVVQSILFIQEGIPVSLADGLHGLYDTYYTVEASSWLKSHYTGGLILTSLASHDAFVARTQLPMRLYIHEGTQAYWAHALQQPSSEATYIAMLSFPPDVVYKAIAKNPDFIHNYTLVHSYGNFGIYKRQ